MIVTFDVFHPPIGWLNAVARLNIEIKEYAKEGNIERMRSSVDQSVALVRRYGMAGRVLVYVPVKAAADLISGDANAGKSVTVNGKLFKAAGALVVESFAAAAAPAAAGGDDEWDSVGTTTVTKGAVI